MITDKLSIIAPAYNEEDNIEYFYERMTRVLDEITSCWEIICINDGSKDQTINKLKDLHERNARVKVLNLSRNFGKEAAMTAGINYATGDAVILIDTDLQDPPELIADMVKLWKEGANIVYATRTQRDGEFVLKKVTATLFYKFIGKITNIDIPRDTGDFRLIDKQAVEALKKLEENQRFMKGLFSWVGYKQVSLPYKREKRHAGVTKFNYWKLWNFAIEGITSFSIMPLQSAMYIGVFVSFFAFLYAIFIMVKTILWGIDVPGYASTMDIMLFFGGIQLIFLGIIGEYIGRIYKEVKRRPAYIIKDIFDK